MDSIVKHKYSVPKATVSCPNCGDSMYMNYVIGRVVHLTGGKLKCDKKRKRVNPPVAEPVIDTTQAVEVIE